MSFTCNCAAGYDGAFCEIDLEPCEPNPCANGGACTADGQEVSCACAAGYAGPSCEQVTDPCVLSPCQNGGACVTEPVTSVHCFDAYPEFLGTAVSAFCPEETELVSHVCGATSMQDFDFGPFGFDVVLTDDQPGDHCWDSCDCNAICAQCESLVSDYSCTCPPGFQGDNCEITIGGCALDPCLNGGVCVDLEDGYSCTCPDDWTGDHCEVPMCGGWKWNSGCWYTSPLPGMTCKDTCAAHCGFDTVASKHVGNEVGMHFWPDKEDGGIWPGVGVECSSIDNNTNHGADGSDPDGGWSDPNCYVNCACGC